MLVSWYKAETATPSSTLELQTVSAKNQVLNPENIFYPKEKGQYRYEGIFHDQQIRFDAKNNGALFYRITLTKERGRRGIAIDSEFILEMNEFLAQNDIPIKEDDSDCQYYDGVGLAHYYTYNTDVCIKLSKILLEVNQFDLNGLSKSRMDEFLKFN